MTRSHGGYKLAQHDEFRVGIAAGYESGRDRVTVSRQRKIQSEQTILARRAITDRRLHFARNVYANTKRIRYHGRILHLRFDGNTCKEPVGKLVLTFNFNIKKKFFFCILYSIHHEDNTFPKNVI